MYELSALGWSPFFEEQWSRWATPGLIPGRIAAEHRGAYEVWSSTGAGLAQLAGRLRHEVEEDGLPGVGDWVALKAPGPHQTTIIERLFTRRTVFIRGAAGRETRAQVVAANVDLVFVVCGLDADFNLHRIDRYLARIWASGAQPAVILSKADLCQTPALRVTEVEERCPGAPVHATSVLHAAGLVPIRESIRPGLTAALAGSSGAGKSTLVNALLGEERMATGEVRARDGRGCHITSHRQLVLLPGGGLLLDTPGMRELQLFDEEGLGVVFEDVEEFAQRCRFTDCHHGAEPGCAVNAAIAAGELEAERLDHYLQLEREAQAYERRHNKRLQRQDERAWGKLSREIHRQMQRKRDE